MAVFAPLLIKDDADLRARAPALWHTVHEAPLAKDVRVILTQVLEFWFFERFRSLTAKEVWANADPYLLERPLAAPVRLTLCGHNSCGIFDNGQWFKLEPRMLFDNPALRRTKDGSHGSSGHDQGLSDNGVTPGGAIMASFRIHRLG